MNRWTHFTNRRPGWILTAGLILTILAASYGLTVFSRLSNGGYGDPNSSSEKALSALTSKFKDQRADLIVLFGANGQSITTDAATAQVVKRQLETAKQTAGVANVVSYFSTKAPDFVSTDGQQTFATIALDGSPAQKIATLHTLQDRIKTGSGVEVAYGGFVAVNDQISTQVTQDLAKAEMLSFPILAILLVLVFRSVVAALVPLGLGGLSILVAFLLVRLITNYTTVSVYAINIITLMGLGLAIDYSLFIVSRFREELAGGASTEAAIATTLRTAGRTVFFSGLTVILCLLGLLVFPQGFLRSMGMGGAAAVAATAILALTVLPAALRLIGHHINDLALPGLHKSLSRPAEHGFWYRYSHFIMRRPLLMFGLAVELLVVLGIPFYSAIFTTPDAKTVPASYSSRQVNDQLAANFAGAGDSHITLAITADGAASSPASQRKLSDYLARLDKVDGVTKPKILGAENNFYNASLSEQYPSQSAAAQRVVRDVRAVTPPAGWSVDSGGTSAELVDLLDGLGSKLPLAGLIILVTTSTLLFIMLGSVIIPLKAVILNVLSLSAAFGVLVWVFQDGHLTQQLGFVTNGSIDATQPVLIFAIAFGLAMDYELFLLSRIKEEYDRTGDNANAVAVGVERTASIITSAALMLVVVIGLFATGKIGIIQQVGVGLGVAVAIDATIVRLVLVPSAMRLLGHLNWWAPAPLARLSKRLGVREEA
jgi:RND superfamily putative drug exporter